MKFNLTTKEYDFLMLLFFAGIVLDSTRTEIEKKFKNYPITYFRKDDELDRIEIRIPNWILVCEMLSKSVKDKCDICWGFPDESDIDEYIQFCDCYFNPFNKQSDCWEFYKGTIGLKRQKDIDCFIFG